MHGYSGSMSINAIDGPEGFAHEAEKRGALPAFLHVEHGEIAGENLNLMHAARLDSRARGVLDAASKLGYYIYMGRRGETRLIQHERVRGLWQNVTEGQYQMTDEGIVYRFEPSEGPLQRLVVVFSSMSADPFETSINRHFVQSYPSLKKFLPPDTGVLRIGDLGGVKGAFYINTTYLPDNVQTVTDFIENFVQTHEVARERVVLYGPSKGGTGSLFHALHSGWHSVSVDPVTADEIYVKVYNDSHFTTGGIFPQTKEEAFDAVVESARVRADDEQWQRAIITSNHSPQKPYTDAHIAPIATRVSVLDSRNPKITGHPTVAANTMWAQVMVLNNVLMGYEYRGGASLIP